MSFDSLTFRCEPIVFRSRNFSAPCNVVVSVDAHYRATRRDGVFQIPDPFIVGALPSIRITYPVAFDDVRLVLDFWLAVRWLARERLTITTVSRDRMKYLAAHPDEVLPMFIAYIVVAVCNFDDVIVGAYADESDAKVRAAQVRDDPDLRHKSKAQASDTECLRIAVYRCEGTEVEEVASYDVD